ncbi:MAG: heavy-metal-associated domain-containing protein [Flavobacteriales bacterium]|nr:heavy-metal-associated domain-containing protein [Flavobacteriales bacterium]
MKKIKNVLLLICLALFSFTVPAEKPKYQKEDFKVWGKCEMCKTTIENAVKSIEGVKTAKWNMLNGKMKVKFNPELTNLDDIHKAIALAGYDTELHKATDESYNNLHFCCKYERPIDKE